MEISKKVMEKINSGEVKIKPKIYFVLGNFLLGAGLVASAIFSAVALNFVFVQLEQKPLIRLFGLGRLGIIQAFFQAPWLFIILTLASVLFGVYLLRKTGTLYKNNPISLIIAILLVITLLGFALNKSGPVKRLQRFINTDQSLSRSNTGVWIQGNVSSIYHDRLVLEVTPHTYITVIIKEDSVRPSKMITTGSCLRVYGSFNKDFFESYGIFGCPKRYLDINERNF